MKWEDDFSGAVKNFINEASRPASTNIEAHMQGLEQAINSISAKTRKDKHNLDIAKLHLKHIRSISRKLKADLEESGLNEPDVKKKSIQEALNDTGLANFDQSDAQLAAAQLIELATHGYFDDLKCVVIPSGENPHLSKDLVVEMAKMLKDSGSSIATGQIYTLRSTPESILRKKRDMGPDFNQISEKYKKLLTVLRGEANKMSKDENPSFDFSIMPPGSVDDDLKLLWEKGILYDLSIPAP